MMDNFKNFGEALAWMMESPENVAVCDSDLSYRYIGGHLECTVGGLAWDKSENTVQNHLDARWSRAPREPLEFRGVGVSSASGWLMQVQIDGEVVNDIRCNALSRAPSGTEFELILKEKN